MNRWTTREILRCKPETVFESDAGVEYNQFLFDFFGSTFNFLQDCEESTEVIELMKNQEQIFEKIERMVSYA